MKEKINDTLSNETGEGAPSQPEIFKLKVVETNPVTMEDEHKEIEVDADKVILLAQKGHRFEDKMAKFNAYVEKKSQERAQEMIAPEVEKQVSELKRQLELSRPSEKGDEDAFGETGENYGDDTTKKMVAVLDKINNRLAYVEDKITKQEKREADIKKMSDEYNKVWNTIQMEYPTVDKETLATFVKDSKATPDILIPVAKLIHSLKKQSINVDDLDNKDKKRLTNEIRKKLEAPSAGIEGTDSKGTESAVPITREGILDASLKLLDEMDFAEEE